jgi:hypothetical protein
MWVASALAELLAEAGLDGAKVAARELADKRSRRDAAVRSLGEGVAHIGGLGSGLTGKVRRDKSAAARMRICSQRGATQPEYERKRREYNKE